MKTLTVKVPESLEEEIDLYARRQGTSRSAVVREALEKLIREDVALAGSFLEGARDLAGLVAGPPDLSTNAEHLAEYGK